MKGNVSAAYLNYLNGTAEDRLNAAYPDSVERTRAYREALRALVEIYGGVREQLGDVCATFISTIPCEGSFSWEDALIGMHVLRATNEELADLLAEDDELEQKARGDSVTDADADASIRRDAKEFNKRHNIDREKLDQYGKSARSISDGIDHEGTSNSFYGGNAREIERGIVESATDDRKIPISVNVKILTQKEEPAADAAPGTQVVAQPPREPENIVITAPDFSLKDPSEAFRAAMRWLGDNIAMIATGSKHDKSFPRIEPLTRLHETVPEHAIESGAVLDLISAMRHRFRKLRAPTGGGSSDLLQRLSNIDPDDPNSMIDLRHALDDIMGEKREGDWEKPWGDGGWRD
jgi:hypothetical protein